MNKLKAELAAYALTGIAAYGALTVNAAVQDPQPGIEISDVPLNLLLSSGFVYGAFCLRKMTDSQIAPIHSTGNAGNLEL